MHLQSLLRRLYPQPGFVYRAAKFVETRGRLTGIEVTVVARKGSKAVCSGCYRKRGVHDRLSERRFTMVPLWALPVTLLYTMRRGRLPDLWRSRGSDPLGRRQEYIDPCVRVV